MAVGKRKGKAMLDWPRVANNDRALTAEMKFVHKVLRVGRMMIYPFLFFFGDVVRPRVAESSLLPKKGDERQFRPDPCPCPVFLKRALRGCEVGPKQVTVPGSPGAVRST